MDEAWPTRGAEGEAEAEADTHRRGTNGRCAGGKRSTRSLTLRHMLACNSALCVCACVRVLQSVRGRQPVSSSASLLSRMYSRPHTQVAPPQQSPSELDLPLFDLSALGGAMEAAAVEEETLVEQQQEGIDVAQAQSAPPAAAAAAAAATVAKSNGHAATAASAVGSAFASLAAMAASSPAPSSSAAAQAAQAAQAAADAEAAALAAAAEDEDLYGTRIRASSLCACVLGSSTSASIALSAASLMDRAGFELDLLQNLSGSAEALAAVFTEATTMPDMVKKNRYSNVIPTRKGRVVLPTGPGASIADSYINACLLPPLLPGCVQPYIAAQAPLPHTAHDFWHMAWTQGTALVVMLTKERERDSRGNVIHKAHPYWPEAHPPTSAAAAAASSSSSSAAAAAAAAAANSRASADLPSAHYGPYTVTLLSTHTEPDLLIRELLVSRAVAAGSEGAVAEEPRQVHQVQYTGWPDFGVPDDSNEATGFMRIFTLYRAIRNHLHKQHAINAANAAAEKEGAPVPAPTPAASASSSAHSSALAASVSSSPSVPLSALPAPVVVHCSAGIGRSGVWIAIDALLDCLAWHASRGTLDQASVDLFALVRRMRESRHGMLQTKEQYAYVLHFVATCMRKQMFGVYDAAANTNAKAAHKNKS